MPTYPSSSLFSIKVQDLRSKNHLNSCNRLLSKATLTVIDRAIFPIEWFQQVGQNVGHIRSDEKFCQTSALVSGYFHECLTLLNRARKVYMLANPYTPKMDTPVSSETRPIPAFVPQDIESQLALSRHHRHNSGNGIVRCFGLVSTFSGISLGRQVAREIQTYIIVHSRHRFVRRRDIEYAIWQAHRH